MTRLDTFVVIDNSKKGWNRQRDFPMRLGSLRRRCRCRHTSTGIDRPRETSLSDNPSDERAVCFNSIRFKSIILINTICWKSGTNECVGFDLSESYLDYFRMWLPPRRFTASTRRNESARDRFCFLRLATNLRVNVAINPEIFSVDLQIFSSFEIQKSRN